MTYEHLIQTISLILESEEIYKPGLTLTYTLEPKNHKAMNELLFYKANPPHLKPDYTDEYEVDIENITIKFIKKIE